MSSLRDAVRDKLREDKVKLWLPPYDTSDAVDALAKTYAGVLQASEPDVAAGLYLVSGGWSVPARCRVSRSTLRVRAGLVIVALHDEMGLCVVSVCFSERG